MQPKIIDLFPYKRIQERQWSSMKVLKIVFQLIMLKKILNSLSNKSKVNLFVVPFKAYKKRNLINDNGPCSINTINKVKSKKVNRTIINESLLYNIPCTSTDDSTTICLQFGNKNEIQQKENRSIIYLLWTGLKGAGKSNTL